MTNTSINSNSYWIIICIPKNVLTKVLVLFMEDVNKVLLVLFIEDECEDEINKKEGVNFFFFVSPGRRLNCF